MPKFSKKRRANTQNLLTMMQKRKKTEEEQASLPISCTNKIDDGFDTKPLEQERSEGKKMPLSTAGLSDVKDSSKPLKSERADKNSPSPKAGPSDNKDRLSTQPLESERADKNTPSSKAGPSDSKDRQQEAKAPVFKELGDHTEIIQSDEEELQFTCEKELEETNKHIGRRIVAVSHFLAKLQEISNHGPLGCTINELHIVGEKQNGLQSKFILKCRLCNMKFVMDGDNCEENYVSVNQCAVAGTIAIGCGQSQLEELLSSVNLPVISPKIYKQNHNLLSQEWEKVLHDSMTRAAEKESKLALEDNRVNKDGIPIIDVIADGCWSKRSYKKNYNALSGAAAIVGKRTGEILYLGIKNKYCSICAQAERANVDCKVHQCYKNFCGPSTNMESDILVEGFKCSVAMHNLIYGRIISDGDSSTYSKILQARPYPDVTVEKVECRNHILRNLCNKIQALSIDTKYPIKFRKLITKQRILTCRAAIIKSIKKHKFNSDVKLLFDDILSSHLHGFGDHSKCRPYFCDKLGTDENTSKDFFYSSIWQRICLIFQSVAGHARSLIHDVDSNSVERYNSIVAKFVGGKRINFSLRNSYQTRCHAAAVSFNENNSMSLLYKSLNKGASPLGKIKKLETKRLKRSINCRNKYRPKNRALHQSNKKPDKSYGPDCLKPDIPNEEMEALKQRFLATLKKTEEERKEIERKTVLQGECSEWLELRGTLLTASNFGKVIKRRADTSCQNFVRDLLYKNNIDHVSSIKHGKENEKLALIQLEKQEGIKIESCGLFIDNEYPFLGATPDGICGNDMIVEMKCPITANKLGLDEAIKKKKVTFWTQKGINKYHLWYYQIQGQMRVTNRSKCLFAVWSNANTPLKTEIIFKDDKFWEQNMLEKLTKFYMDCLLPEIIDPRHPRGMPIRDPEYIEEAIRKKKNKENYPVNL